MVSKEPTHIQCKAVIFTNKHVKIEKYNIGIYKRVYWNNNQVSLKTKVNNKIIQIRFVKHDISLLIHA